MTPRIDLQTELAKRQICLCGIVFRGPANVIDEVRMLLKQSNNTRIQYCIASFDVKAAITLEPNIHCIQLDPER